MKKMINMKDQNERKLTTVVKMTNMASQLVLKRTLINCLGIE